MLFLVGVHIVILQIKIDIWCDRCCVPSAHTITYAVEDSAGIPLTLRRLTYCEACEDS